jgi:hypothetical protein
MLNFRNTAKSADKILRNLSAPPYLMTDCKNNFLIQKCVGNLPAGSEVDVPLIYADYYFLEANLRKRRLAETNAEADETMLFLREAGVTCFYTKARNTGCFFIHELHESTQNKNRFNWGYYSCIRG